MAKQINLKRGHDLMLEGSLPSDCKLQKAQVKFFAVCPDDFPGFIPKLDVKEGDNVLCGSSLMHHKDYDDMKLVSPVAGKVTKVMRGERRKILFVEIELAAEQSPSLKFKNENSKEVLQKMLLNSGLWAMMRQRPYDIVPSPNAVPVNIFVTGFSSAPLAATLENNSIVTLPRLEAGVKLLKEFTSGNIYISVRPGAKFNDIKGAEMVEVKGPHPAGNAGVQAANIAPVNKGETIWTLDLTTLARIGKLALESEVDWSTEVALVGPEVEKPELLSTFCGANIGELVTGNLKDDGKHKRIVSGDVLSGVKVDSDGWLRYPYHQISVIAEGDQRNEFMGWASLSPEKMSLSRSFLSWLMPKKKYAPDARLLGGKRAMIMSGTYESMLPMDIMAEQLIKAIIGGDIERMEQLGIYEVAPEDFALCEYADPSKLELQKIVRQGLDKLRKELE